MPGSTSKRYPVELRERAVRMVGEIRSDQESERAAMTQVAQLLGVGTPETVRTWCRQAEVDAGRWQATTSDESADLKRLKQENVPAASRGLWVAADGVEFLGARCQNWAFEPDLAEMPPASMRLGTSQYNRIC